MTLIPREESIEQAYFFRVLKERLEDNTPIQEILGEIREEILATTRLPLAIDFLAGELKLHGQLAPGMQRLSHYFTGFQAFIIERAEHEESRLDFRVALRILEREAELKGHGELSPAALFVYQFECVARNRLGYDDGLLAIAKDPLYSEDWSRWIARLRFDLGTSEFAELVYVRSEQFVEEQRQSRRDSDWDPPAPVLFDRGAGRIARANRGKDPLYMFAALQRQLGYPAVPRPPAQRSGPLFPPHVEQRFQRIETRLGLVEQEQRGGLDLSKFYQPGEAPRGAVSPDYPGDS